MYAIRQILLAIDLGPESGSLIERARENYFHLVEGLHVIHVIRQGLYDSGPGREDVMHDPHTQHHRDHLSLEIRKLLHRHGLTVPADNIHLVYGEPACEIKRLAAEMEADLVIVGSHCKTEGWLSLPGATTNCVIQGIGSDVIAVKL